MTTACIEHVNLTVSQPDTLAEHFCHLFDWHIRWSGAALSDGYTVHVGSENRYFALYTHPDTEGGSRDPMKIGSVNHVGLVVNDLDEMEQKVLTRGFTTNNHRDYGHCKSFYFMADNSLEIEIVSYKESSIKP